MRRGAEALSKFSDGLTSALTSFKESAGSESSLGRHALGRPSFSGTGIPFSEADDLQGQYGRVHDSLMHMSQTLGLHIEALQLAAQAADATYNGSEDEVRRRFWEIKTQIDEEYQKMHPKEHEQPRKDTRQHTDDKASGVSSS
ncbi:hypothetical protein AQI88_37510 [Streptomyces cellostaticus]|uniref:Uncharacterized protein n=1 Tax=Streptomyces cellostaticus TaxID=67285 RepID=A0A101NE67_9ACTN|nr:hypothetical protein AQI88_37510 [Streptomyces cellostaticus]